MKAMFNARTFMGWKGYVEPKEPTQFLLGDRVALINYLRSDLPVSVTMHPLGLSSEMTPDHLRLGGKASDPVKTYIFGESMAGPSDFNEEAYLGERVIPASRFGDGMILRRHLGTEITGEARKFLISELGVPEDARELASDTPGSLYWAHVRHGNELVVDGYEFDSMRTDFGGVTIRNVKAGTFRIPTSEIESGNDGKIEIEKKNEIGRLFFPIYVLDNDLVFMKRNE
jgi:hypothetical protein